VRVEGLRDRAGFGTGAAGEVVEAPQHRDIGEARRANLFLAQTQGGNHMRLRVGASESVEQLLEAARERLGGLLDAELPQTAAQRALGWSMRVGRTLHHIDEPGYLVRLERLGS
jgi:hypothetical protein